MEKSAVFLVIAFAAGHFFRQLLKFRPGHVISGIIHSCRVKNILIIIKYIETGTHRQRYLLAVQLQGVRSVHRRNIHAVFFYIRSQILQLSSFCDGRRIVRILYPNHVQIIPAVKHNSQLIGIFAGCDINQFYLNIGICRLKSIHQHLCGRLRIRIPMCNLSGHLLAACSGCFLCRRTLLYR